MWRRKRRRKLQDLQRMLDFVDCRRGHTCFGWQRTRKLKEW